MLSERRTLRGFFVLTFALSAPLWALGSLLEIQLLPGLPIGALAAFTPAVAAVILVHREGRVAAVRSLLRRSFDAGHVRDERWYVLLVLFNPAVAVLSFYIMRSMGTAIPHPPSLTLAVVPLLAVFFTAALGEEMGWTGYATEPLLRRRGVLTGGVLLGSVWVAFHVVPLLQMGRSIEWIAWWSLGTLCLRVIMVWLYVRAGDSVFAASVFHAMINVSWQLFPIDGSFYDPRTFSLVTAALGVLLGVSLHLASRVARKTV